MIQFADQIRIRLFVQTIKGILRFPQKLLNYFKGTVIFDFMTPSLLVSNNLEVNLTLFKVEGVAG